MYIFKFSIPELICVWCPRFLLGKSHPTDDTGEDDRTLLVPCLVRFSVNIGIYLHDQMITAASLTYEFDENFI